MIEEGLRLIPVMAVTTCEPPSTKQAPTSMFVAKPLNRYVICAILPCRASTISGNVCAPGAFALILIAIKANSRIWKVPIAPYHMGPQTPYVYANVELVSSVALQVQEDTMPAAMRPGLTEREAVVNSSACLEEKRV